MTMNLQQVHLRCRPCLQIKIDVAYVGAAPVIAALANGLDAKIVAAVQIQGSDLVLKTDLPYESPEDLRGLTIATFPAGNHSGYSAKELAERERN